MQRTESYGYDANLDYLTSANYGDGLSNATPSWTYDAAGNRSSDSTNSGTWSYDNLNRMTASPNTTYTNDTLGNRTGKTVSSTSTTYSWDDLNRMTSLASGGTTTGYAYRADGLRVSKSSSSGSTHYRYDGQMGSEDVELNSSSTITGITRSVLGGRGIDAISRTTSSGTTVAYPLYDVHGNNVGMLAKSVSFWLLGDERTYDAWGQVRAGASTGTQAGRFCASLGHKHDDESGLTYMRARYYEPASGRFVSEDPAHEGINWLAYCGNDPINFADFNGKVKFGWATALQAFMLGFLTIIVTHLALEGEFKAPLSEQVVALVVAIFSGTKAEIEGLSKLDEGIYRIFNLEQNILTSPEEQIAEDGIAGRAIDAFSFEAGEDVAALLSITIDAMGY